MRFPPKVVDTLLKAGWFPGRNVDLVELPDDFTLFDKAEKVLREFYGLHVGSCGSGIELATSDIDFRPKMGEGFSQEIGCTDSHGLRLYPLGQTSSAHAYLFINENGQIYFFFDELEWYASSLEEALLISLYGLKSRSPRCEEFRALSPEG